MYFLCGDELASSRRVGDSLLHASIQSLSPRWLIEKFEALVRRCRKWSLYYRRRRRGVQRGSSWQRFCCISMERKSGNNKQTKNILQSSILFIAAAYKTASVCTDYLAAWLLYPLPPFSSITYCVRSKVC